MKFTAAFFLFSILTASCRFSEVEVDSDYSYFGKFHRYKTFAFIDNQTFNGGDGEKRMIEQNIARILQSWGYRYKENKADFLISYDFFFEDLKLRGYDQPEFHSWVHSRFGNDLVKPNSVSDTTQSDDLVRRREEQYKSASMRLNEGTIYINFMDRKKERSVWQGYAAGVFNHDSDRNERRIRAAIIRILDEFRLITLPS
ncbi:MAG: DUF4136 domain-containing protein [Bacteroidota bacterium]